MKILLAVSGGIDSMYLANRASDIFPGASFAVAHCNFSLRGDESDGDETFVRQWCNEHATDCFVKKFDTKEYAEEHSVSVEMAARELRYRWFAELCDSGFDAVAVAHNANDNAETLMLNLLRGTGIRGIRGMAADRDGRPRIIRPLLGTTRSEIRHWMEENGCQWREDSSNSSDEYKRNIIRNEVFPIFHKINPSFISSLNDNMGRFAQVDDLAEDYFLSVKDTVVSDAGDIYANRLLGLKHWRYVLHRLLENTGINAEQEGNLEAALEGSGKTFSGKTFGPVKTGAGKIILPGNITDREPSIEIIGRKELASLKQEEGTIIMDAGRLPSPLKIRKWREGDWMKPLGMKGKKKLSDLFVDLKWSVAEKSSARVVELEGSHIAALLCVRIDDSVKVTSDTEKVVRISYSSTSS